MSIAKKIKNRRRVKNELDLDITSLLDILVILLVFLLKSYSASDLRVDLVENLTLPPSVSEDFGETSVIVQVNRKQEIWVNDESIGRLVAKNQIIESLASKLKEIKEVELQAIEANRSLASSEEVDQKKEKLDRINLILDEEIPYQVMRQVMHTAATSGFPEFKFIVRGLSD
jgi:biopolymer transport protein ExbD